MRLQISHFKKCSFLILTQNTHELHTTNFLIVRLLLKEKSTFKSLSQLLIPIVVRKTFSFRKMAYKIYPTQRISSRFRTDPPPCRRIILCHPRLIHATKNTVRHIPSGTYTRGRTYGKTYTRRKSMRERTIVGALVMCEELIC